MLKTEIFTEAFSGISDREDHERSRVDRDFGWEVAHQALARAPSARPAAQHDDSHILLPGLKSPAPSYWD